MRKALSMTAIAIFATSGLLTGPATAAADMSGGTGSASVVVQAADSWPGEAMVDSQDKGGAPGTGG